MAGEIKGVTAKENLKKYYEEGWQIATWLNDHPEISGQEKERIQGREPLPGSKIFLSGSEKRKGQKKKAENCGAL